MLVEAADPVKLLGRWAGRSLPRQVMAHWLAQGSGDAVKPARLLFEDANNPQVAMRMHRASITIHGTEQGIEAVLRHVIESGMGRPRDGLPLHLSRVQDSTLRTARCLGFSDSPGEVQPYYQARAWHIRGRPRFATQVRHACRIARGLELLPLFLAGDERDEALYLRACLLSGPSFVCEVKGQPVSWSLTHLGGAIGRIYTPPEFRGRGYAGSLVALQVDTLLAAKGIAVASVRVDNAGSFRIFQRLEGRALRQPLGWSRLCWPH